MPQKAELSPSSVADLLDKMAGKKYAFNFDVTLELNTPELQVGSLRVHGRVESVPGKK